MKIFTILSDFITQYIPDFAANVVPYLLLLIVVLLVVRIVRG